MSFKEMDTWDDGEKQAESSMIFVGSQAMIDPVRPEAVLAIREAQGAGIKVTIVTGDHKSTATAIAKEIGLMDGGNIAIDGAEFDAMSDEELSKKIDKIKVFARVTPEQKMRVLDILQKKGEIVAMTGDGVNDAPALKKADIGIAMGIKGTDVARETAQIVLADDNFASIVKGIAEGRGIMINIKKFVYYLLSSNIAEVMILFFGMLLGWPLILIPVQLLWINLVTDSITALSLGLDPKPEDVMRQPPRDPKEKVLPQKTLLALCGLAFVTAAVILALFSIELSESEDLARTMAFIGLIFAETYNLFNFKSFNKPLHKINVFDNKYLIGAALLSIMLSVVVIEIPFFASLFHLVPLDPVHWLAIIALGSIVLIAGEVYKNMVFYKIFRS
jgi:Ca2+-transporting ATPase